MSTKPMQRFKYYTPTQDGEETEILLKFHDFVTQHRLSRTEMGGLLEHYKQHLDTKPVGDAVKSADLLPPLLTA